MANAGPCLLTVVLADNSIGSAKMRPTPVNSRPFENPWYEPRSHLLHGHTPLSGFGSE